MPFKKGQVTNPTGRPKRDLNVAYWAQQHTEFAFKKIVSLMDCEDPRVVLAACQEVLNRAWGKPAQAITVTKDVVHYVVKVPAPTPTAIEWQKQNQPNLKQ